MKHIAVALMAVVCVLVSRPKDQGVPVRLREKYGPVVTVDSVNLVVLHDGVWYVTRAGERYGAYSAANYAVEVGEGVE